MNIINTREVLEQVKKAVEDSEAAKGNYNRAQAQRAMEAAKLLVLASIAQSLDSLVKNGIVMEKP